MDNNYDLTGLILKKAYEVHTALGPGLLESTYEECLCYELSLYGLQVERQKTLPIEYRRYNDRQWVQIGYCCRKQNRH